MSDCLERELFTVTIWFYDLTFAVEQVTTETANSALGEALRQAEALCEHDRASLDDLAANHVLLYQVAGLRGVWIWGPSPDRTETLADILGGTIVQTDREGPTRPSAAG